MADFNQILGSGDIDNGLFNCVIEIPEGSHLKIEWQKDTATFKIDRLEPSIYPKPASYGFIPRTLDSDGDELDALIVSSEPIPTGVWLEARIIGVLDFEDDGEDDHKIIGVISDDRNTGDNIKSLEDLGEQWKKKVEEHFKHYKDLKKPGTTIVKGWGDIEEAKKIIKECQERFSTK